MPHSAWRPRQVQRGVHPRFAALPSNSNNGIVSQLPFPPRPPHPQPLPLPLSCPAPLQLPPNAINTPNFPDEVLRPGEEYRHVMTYKFYTV